jgi:hypothetical protein
VIILKEGEGVPQKDEIGFIFVILKDLSKQNNDDQNKSMAEEEAANLKKKAEEDAQAQEDKKIKE